jgi:hypothetical protein
MFTYFYLSLICAFFIYMLDYGLGKPGDERPVYGNLLFAWSFLLAKKALGSDYNIFALQYADQLQNASNALERKEIKRNFQDLVFRQGRTLFTWQKIVGMCPICTHFWFTIIIFLSVNIFYFHVNIIIFTLYFLTSHVLIRLLKKYA